MLARVGHWERGEETRVVAAAAGTGAVAAMAGVETQTCSRGESCNQFLGYVRFDNRMVTVAILAQGTHWAVASM